MSTVLWLATIGGMVSFISTTIGTCLSLVSTLNPAFSKFKFSMDFALGLMLSAVAFSLVAPAAVSSFQIPGLWVASLLGFVFGGMVIYLLKILIESKQTDQKKSSSQLILALALLIHNFPEGLASGGALAGLSEQAAISILTSISIQNVPEGLLMVFCLRAMGWKRHFAFMGGIASGLVELLGGICAGVALNATSSLLPVMLMFAGGSMFVSVVIELRAQGSVWQHFRRPEFSLGMISIPCINFILS